MKLVPTSPEVTPRLVVGIETQPVSGAALGATPGTLRPVRLAGGLGGVAPAVGPVFAPSGCVARPRWSIGRPV